MAPKQYENILLLRMLHIPFRQKRIAIIRGQSIGIPTENVIWLSAFSRNSSGSAESSLAMISSIRHSWRSFMSALFPSC